MVCTFLFCNFHAVFSQIFLPPHSSKSSRNSPSSHASNLAVLQIILQERTFLQKELGISPAFPGPYAPLPVQGGLPDGARPPAGLLPAGGEGAEAGERPVPPQAVHGRQQEDRPALGLAPAQEEHLKRALERLKVRYETVSPSKSSKIKLKKKTFEY